MEPAVAPRLGRRLGHGVVAAVEDPRLVGAHDELSDITDCNGLVVLVDDPHVVAGPAAVQPPARLRVRERVPSGHERSADLGHAVAGADLDAEARLELLDLGDERTHHHVAQRRVGVVGRLGLHQQERRHRADEAGAGDVVGAHVVPEVLDRELLADDHARAQVGR